MCLAQYRGKKAVEVDIIVQLTEIEDDKMVIRNGRWGMWKGQAGPPGYVESQASGMSSSSPVVYR